MQKAHESRAYELSQELGELSRKVDQRKLLLQRLRDKTPCDCATEFDKLEEFENHIDEGYDFLLVRFDKIEEEQEYDFTTQVSII